MSLPATRRSTRLQNQSKSGTVLTKQAVAAEIQSVAQPKTRKRKRSASPITASSSTSTLCSEDKPDTSSTTNLRRSNRIAPGDMTRREKELLKKEQACQRRVDELDQRCLQLGKREEDAQLMISRMEEEQAKSSLSLLEEHFTCPLCYDIMARPFCLQPCGHTFCAICSLKWFFSKLHKACGGWHEAVSCPTCRSLLVITPHDAPRKEITFPFVPNRTATDMLEDIISKLATSNSEIKKEYPELPVPAIDCAGLTSSTETTGLASWKEGGNMRMDWLKKCREGKDEMAFLKANWATLSPHDFVTVKQRLA